MNWARETFPNRPLFGVGFSLGACILTNVRTLFLGLGLLITDYLEVRGRGGLSVSIEISRRCRQPFQSRGLEQGTSEDFHWEGSLSKGHGKYGDLNRAPLEHLADLSFSQHE